MGIRNGQTFFPEPDMGFYLQKPGSSNYFTITPRIIAHDFYVELQTELEDLMTVEEWHKCMEELDRTGQLDSALFPPRFIIFNSWPIEGGLRESRVEEPITVEEWERQVEAMEEVARRSIVKAK